ncbi:MAG: hypothetical protein SXG53_19730, partial [Pseudomonadota bacterium]|nr:hypothetical protein [Pseudomonadota bacterium]
ASTAHQLRAQTSKDSFEGPSIRRSGTQSIEDQQLRPEQQRLGTDGASTARQPELTGVATR